MMPVHSPQQQQSYESLHVAQGSHPGLAPQARKGSALREKLGICQWFHYEDYTAVDQSIELLSELGVRHLRTGISWADYLRDGGRAWYDWQMRRLAESGLELLLSVWHTPPSLSESNACNGPPRRLRDYADFLDLVIDRYGGGFHHLELWNEPNNRLKWNFAEYDPQWAKFAEMIGAAAYWAKQRGQRTVLGGMIPVDPHWLALMDRHGVLVHTDIVGIHAFPGMWFPHHPNWDWHGHWNGWEAKLATVTPAAKGRPIWVTETGIATWDLALSRRAKFDLQEQMLLDAALHCPADKVYWYSLIDLDPGREAIEGFHVDENEYHMGLVTCDGWRKPTFDAFAQLLRTSH
jgi:CDP-paratose 2-epimerase